MRHNIDTASVAPVLPAPMPLNHNVPFVVFAHTGEYEDRRSWPVVAFTFENDAEAWAKAANDWAEAHDVAFPHASYEARDAILDGDVVPPYDPRCRYIDHTGVQYRVRRAEHVPLNPKMPADALPFNVAPERMYP